MAQNLSRVFLSNRLEQLYEELKTQLFAGTQPFARRVILVPSTAMKTWLRLRMAEDPEMGIATGIEIGFVEFTLNQLYQQFFVVPANTINEPSELEMALAIEKIILSKLNALEGKEWKPLSEYLALSFPLKGTVSRKILSRIRGLASFLAKLFRHYGLYGQQLLAHWKEGLHSFPHWQSLLWQELESLFSPWQYPVKKFSSFHSKDKPAPQDVYLHLFGFNFLAPIYHQLLQKLATLIPIYYYLLSPCQKFWGDTLSDKEQIKLRDFWDQKGATQASLESLEDLLRERNPILANFGRLGREMTQTIESMDALSTEKYVLPQTVLSIPAYEDLLSPDLQFEDTKTPLTLLQALQTDLALLRSPEHQEKISFQDYDETIQIHAIPKISREVQVIYDLILGIIDKHRDTSDPILPGDILVMAPNICEYAPFIRSVFESDESQLEIQLMDIEAPAHSLVVQGFLQLLSLSNGRWEASALLQLLDYPAFLLRHRLSQEDVLVIHKWVKEAAIFWGSDSTHRDEFYHRKYQTVSGGGESFIGTWEHGLGRILEGLAIVPDTSLDGDYENRTSIEASQSDLLGTVLRLVRSLQADLKPLQNETQLTLQEWTTYLHCLFDTYFLPAMQDTKEAEGIQFLKICIEEFAKASTQLQETLYSF
jgi:exodeoxyribonuclease V gamma subunit